MLCSPRKTSLSSATTVLAQAMDMVSAIAATAPPWTVLKKFWGIINNILCLISKKMESKNKWKKKKKKESTIFPTSHFKMFPKAQNMTSPKEINVEIQFPLLSHIFGVPNQAYKQTLFSTQVKEWKKIKITLIHKETRIERKNHLNQKHNSIDNTFRTRCILYVTRWYKNVLRIFQATKQRHTIRKNAKSGGETYKDSRSDGEEASDTSRFDSKGL